MGWQRWVHYYGLTEALHLAVFFCLCAYAHQPKVISHWPRALFVVVAYGTFTLITFVLIGVLLCIKRSYRPSYHVDTSAPKYPIPKFTTFSHETRDGVKLKVSVAKSESSSKVMLLACPLGQCGPSIFNPIMCWFGPEFTYVTWDYRGFFGSEMPNRLRKISIPEHANDGMEVLRACGYSKADMMVGHSMGTAVSFETVLLHPEAIGALVILNGFHGHVFNTAFQLLWRLPMLGDLLSELIAWLLRKPDRIDSLRLALQPVVNTVLPIHARISGSKMLKKISGENYLLDFFNSYLGTICETTSNTESWLRLFQELDAHSIYHLLPTITHPLLLISGYLDMATPPMQSIEISRQVKQAEHYCDPFSTHASLMESPEWVVAEIDVFARKHVLGKQGESKEKNN